PARAPRSPPRAARMGALADAHLLAGNRCAIACGSGLDALDNPVVAGAATQVAHHPGPGLVDRRPRTFRQQRRSRDDLTGRTDAALKATLANKRVLECAQVLLVWCQPFDRG